MVDKIVAGFLGVILGGILGFFGGVIWYELVEVPKAATMDPIYAQSYLCSAGNGAPILGVMVGGLFGIIFMLAHTSRHAFSLGERKL